MTIPDSVTAIRDFAFCRCTSLTSITLPSSLISIGYSAFYHCDDLTRTIPRDAWLTQWCQDNGLRYTCPDVLDRLPE